MSFFDELTEAREFMNLPPLVSIKELKKTYRELSKNMHPDHGGKAEDMQRLGECYAIVLSYMENYRFKFSEEEVMSQFPYENYKKRFRF